MATRNDFRVSDAEREVVAEQLREHFAQGRLTLDELQDRLEAAFAARMRSELDGVTADLPHVRPVLPSSPGRAAIGTGQPGGQGGDGEQPGQPNLAARFATVAMIVAVVACLLLVGAWYTHGPGSSFSFHGFWFFRRLPLPPLLVFAFAILAALRALRGRLRGGRRRGRR
jgi:hypothetical protein